MAHHSYIRPAGVWLALADLLSSEMAAFDLAQFGSIDGDTGGSWAPSTPIVIGGDGLQLGNGGTNHRVLAGATFQVDATGALLVLGNAAFNGAVVLAAASSTAVSAGATWFWANGSSETHGATAVTSFANKPSFTGGVSITNGDTCTIAFKTGSTMAFEGASTLSILGTTTAQWASGTFANFLTGSKLRVEGNGTLQVDDGAIATLAAPVDCSAHGTIRQRDFHVVVAAETIDANDYDVVEISVGGPYVITVNGVYTKGQKIRFFYSAAAATVNVLFSGTAQTFFFHGGGGAIPEYWWADLVFDGVTWRPTAWAWALP